MIPKKFPPGGRRFKNEGGGSGRLDIWEYCIKTQKGVGGISNWRIVRVEHGVVSGGGTHC